MIPNSIIIIGSGLGGLLSGYLLSKEGFNVTLLEKHRKFGGCLQTFKRDRYSFDTGMHYIGSMSPGQPLHNYWKFFGLSERLDLLQMDEDGFDRISFGSTNTPNNKFEYPIAQGFINFKNQLLPSFPDAAPALESYLKSLMEITQSHPLYNLEVHANSVKNQYTSIKASDFLNNLGSRIPDPGSRIRFGDVLSGNNLLYAGNPATTPLSQFGLINHSFISSAWRLAGGSQQIADILVEGIRANGGEVLAKKKVTSIGRTGDLFKIETADGDRFVAGRIISDIHPAATLQLLSGIPVQKAFRQRIAHLPNTISVFTVYLGLKPDTFPFLNYNVYHHLSSSIWADSMSVIGETGSVLPSFVGEGTGVGCTWPSQFLFMTPPEKDQGEFADTAVILAPMHFRAVAEWENSASGSREKSYFVFKAKKAKLLLDAVYEKFPNLKDAVATIEISTPLTWRDYTGTPQGSLFGIIKDACHPQKTTIFPKTKTPGLYFTGQNVNLHGALGVTIGAVMTCGGILGLQHLLTKIKQAI